MRVLLRVKETGNIIREKSAVSEKACRGHEEYLRAELSNWYRSDQFIGRTLEVVRVPSYAGEKLNG